MIASLWSALLACAPGSYELVVHVVDEVGAPLSGAWVDIDGVPYEADAEGVVELKGLDTPALLLIGAPGCLTEPVPAGPDDGVLEVRLWSSYRRALHFGGDVMLGRRYQAPDDGDPLIPQSDAYASTAALLAPLGRAFAVADHSVLNLETVVSAFPSSEPALDAGLPNTPDDALPYPGKRWVMQTPPEAAQGAIDALGVDEVVLANNHQRDWEDIGVTETLVALGCDDPTALRTDLCLGGGETPPEAALASVHEVGGMRVGGLAYTSVNGDYVNDQYPLVADPEATPEEAWMYTEVLWGEPELGVAVAERNIGEAWRALSAAEEALDEAQQETLWRSARAQYPGLQDWVARRGHGGANPWDADRAEDEIEALREEVDLLVVQLHMGFQFSGAPSEGLRAAATLAADAGADLVIAHHPHVLQGVEWMGDTLVVWSLGNLAFDQNFLATFPSAFLRVITDIDGEVLEARLLPLWIDAYQPVPVVGARARFVLSAVQEASLRRATASRASDRSISSALEESDDTLAHLIMERGGATITRADDGLIGITEDSTLTFGRGLERLDPGLWLGPAEVELGRPLLGLGDFEDLDTDEARGDVSGWRILGSDDGPTHIEASEGRVCLELVADPDQSGASIARLVARTPMPAHRLFDADGAPADGPASYSVRLMARADGERDLGRVRLALYHFDDLDPLRLPSSALLREQTLPFELDGAGWQEVVLELPPEALDPVDGLAPNMALFYVEVEAPSRYSTLMRFDEIELIEWRSAAAPSPAPAAFARGPVGRSTLSRVIDAPADGAP